jgi:GT2 family glycosyltransferase
LSNAVNPESPDFNKKERAEWIEWVYLMSTTRMGVSILHKWPFRNDMVPILAYSGVSALIKRDISPSSKQFFDPSISHFLGDVDLGIRVSILGDKAVLVPGAIIYHIEDNKSWTDKELLYRAFIGARDIYVVYYKNMFTAKFIAFLPILLVGVPTKVFALRVNWITKAILFIAALLLSPLVCLSALIQLPKHKESRKKFLPTELMIGFGCLRR